MFVGVQSFLLQLVDQVLQRQFLQDVNKGFVFLAFTSWAMYFLLGKNIKTALQGLCGYVMGIGFAVIMLLLGEVLSFLEIWSVPVVALIVVPVMMYYEYATWYISNVATFFIGAGAFYNIFTYVPDVTIRQSAGIVIFYCILGLVSGFITIYFRTWYEKILKEKQDE
jgi:hypothetical protein